MNRRRRTAIPESWDGPSKDAYDDPCPGCDGKGVVDDGLQVDVDDFIPALCGDCDGTGVNPEPEEPEPEIDPIFAGIFKNLGL